MQIAITGGSGRVGRTVVALALEQGHTVVSIDQTLPADQVLRADLHFVQANLADHAAAVAAIAGSDAVIHLAAIPHPRAHPAHEVHNNNVTSSYNILIAAAELGITHVCQASSINATGAAFSRHPRFDYVPLDEQHPTYNEDAYSLSKWICEAQADSVARRYEEMQIASLRFHWVVDSRAAATQRARDLSELLWRQLWGYTCIAEAARACLLGVAASYQGHEAFQIVAPDTMMETPTAELLAAHFPDIDIRSALPGNSGLYDCSKAERLLGWRHP
jgi:nucleoside-diphosphate-sugar epimerase